MASMKNTIVLGCFILASAMAHAFLSGMYEARYEALSVLESNGSTVFDKRTGTYRSWQRADYTHEGETRTGYAWEPIYQTYLK
jgi:hypothetical protein